MVRWQNIYFAFLGLCFLFVFYDLKTKRTEVGYFSRYLEFKSFPLISLCADLNVTSNDYHAIGNCTNYQNSTNPYVNLVCYVTKLKLTKELIPSQIIEYARSIEMHQMFNVTTDNYAIKRSSIYLNNMHICMTFKIDESKTLNNTNNITKINTTLPSPFKYEEQINSIRWDQIDYLNPSTFVVKPKFTAFILNKYHVSAKLFVVSDKELSYLFSLYKFLQYCNPKNLQCNAGQLVVTKTFYTKLQHPYTTDCFFYDKANFDFTVNPVYSRVACISECLKSVFPKFSYLYTKKDDYPLNRSKAQSFNQRECHSKCSKDDCVRTFHYTSNWRNLSTSKPLIKVIFLNNQYQIVTYSTMSQLTYLLQLTSYLCLIYNNNLIVQIIIIYKELVRHLIKISFTRKLGNLLGKEQISIRIYFLSVNLAIFLLFKTLDGVIKENKNQNDNSFMSYTDYPLNYTHILVTICFPLNHILKNEFKEVFLNKFDSYKNNEKMSEHDHLKLNDLLLNRFTINELNNLTKEASDLIKARIAFNDLHGEDIRNNKKIVFQPSFRLLNQTHRVLNVTLYSKCFVYNVSKVELPIQRLFRMSSAIFQILHNHEFSHFTITEKNQYPTFQDVKLFTDCNIQRILDKSYEKESCKMYRQKIDGCERRNRCVEKCIKKSYAQKFKRIPFNVVYGLDERIRDVNGLEVERVDPFVDQNPKLKQIEQFCAEKFRLKDCEFANYINLHSCTNEDFRFNEIKIRLYLPSLVALDVNRWTFSEYFNQTTTMLTVLFGFSMPGILRFIFKCIRIIFKMNLNSINKFRPVIRALLFLFMVYNFGTILNRVIGDKDLLPYSAYRAFDSFSLPRVTTCVKYNYTEIENRFEKVKLNGLLLDELTSHITIDKLYRKIAIYSKDLQPVTVDVKKLTSNRKHEYHNLSFRHFYFQNYKCFLMKIDIVYDTNNYDLFYLDDMIKMYLNYDAPIERMTYSLSPQNTINFNEINDIKLNCLHLISFESYFVS